jgi:cation:H+ antiporter
MFLSVIGIIGGLILLSFGADRFVEGAASTARYFRLSPFLIGFIIVGFATSTPEILVSSVASLNGEPAIGLGNAIGSNIANIGLVLGITVLVSPLLVDKSLLIRDFPAMFVVFALVFYLLSDFRLDRLDGVILLITLFILLVAAIVIHRRIKNDEDTSAGEGVANTSNSILLPSFWLLTGLFLLLFGSSLLVDSAVFIAEYFDISEMIIGLTIVAVGTSLPELAASVASALKGKPDMALGNLIGSNMFNALAVLAMPGLLAPSNFGPQVLFRDVTFMIVLSISAYLLSLGWGRDTSRLGRLDGIILLLGFIGYQTLLFFQL